MKTHTSKNDASRDGQILARIFRAAGVALVRDQDGFSRLTPISEITTTRVVHDRESAGLQHGGCTTPRGLGWKANKPLMRKPTAMCSQSREGIARQNFPVDQIRGRELFAQMRRRLAAV